MAIRKKTCDKLVSILIGLLNKTLLYETWENPTPSENLLWWMDGDQYCFYELCKTNTCK